MDQNRWQKIQQVFEQSLELQGVSRETYLDTACEGDEELRKEVLALLDSVNPSSDFFYALEQDISQAFKLEEEKDFFLGMKLGPFQVVEEIGSGGMGRVFRAERVEGDFDQEVAIKFMKQDPWSDSPGDHFKKERQFLALLKHPYIARIYDGGNTKQGYPYIIMEYVEGGNVVEFVKNRHLDLEEKISLFIKIAKSIAYAHQNLILHRDIKPSNILMSKAMEPRLLDFGIAKALEQGENPVDSHTFKAFTPEYASPEQLQGNPLSTGSDIYQLGLLLYELITGKRAISLQRNDLQAYRRSILENMPPYPSTVVPDPRQSKKIKGDLDAIVMACIQKDPDQRYLQVGDLIQDLEAFLKDEPISLRAHELNYRASKFFKRNKVGVGLSMLALVFLIGGIFFTSKEAIRANQALKKQEEALIRESAVTDFLKSLVMQKDPYGLLANGEKEQGLSPLEEDMDQMVDEFFYRFQENPLLQRELLFISVDYYRKLESYAKAADVLERLGEICERTGDCPPEDRLLIPQQYALSMFSVNKTSLADSAFQEAMEVAGQMPLTSLNQARKSILFMDYAEFLSALGKVTYADSLFDLAFFLFNAQTDSLLARSLNHEISSIFLSWSKVKGNLGDYQAAIHLADSGRMIQREKYGDGNFSNVKYLYQMGSMYMYIQQWDSSEKHLRKGIEIYESTGKKPDWLISALKNDLANVLGGQRKYEEQERLLEETLVLKQEIFGTGHLYNAPTWLSLGHARMFLKKYKASEEAYQKALLINQKNLNPGHQNIAASYLALARLSTTRDLYQKAIGYAKRGLKEVETSLPADHRVVAFGQLFLGQALFRMQRYPEAEEVLVKSLASMKKLNLQNNIEEIEGYLAEIQKP